MTAPTGIRMRGRLSPQSAAKAAAEMPSARNKSIHVNAPKMANKASDSAVVASKFSRILMGSNTIIASVNRMIVIKSSCGKSAG